MSKHDFSFSSAITQEKKPNAKFYYLVDEGDTKMFFTIVTNSNSIMAPISVNLELTRPQNL